MLFECFKTVLSYNLETIKHGSRGIGREPPAEHHARDSPISRVSPGPPLTSGSLNCKPGWRCPDIAFIRDQLNGDVDVEEIAADNGIKDRDGGQRLDTGRHSGFRWPPGTGDVQIRLQWVPGGLIAVPVQKLIDFGAVFEQLFMMVGEPLDARR